MAWKQQIAILKSMLRSRRFIALCLAILAFIAALILLGLNHSSESDRRKNYVPHWFQEIYQSTKRKPRVDITSISWAKREPPIRLLNPNEGIDERERKRLYKKEERFMKTQLSKHKKHVTNYTSCLSRRFEKFHTSFHGQSLTFPLDFSAMMANFHKDCNVEIFGRTENKCHFNEEKMSGNLAVKDEYLKMSKLKKELQDVRLGGIWSPMECVPKAKLAVIIPFRNRQKHLPVLLRQLHPILQKQNLLYRIFVIEQADLYPFNRGKLMNVGFNEAIKMFDFDCFVFHDVDLIPENDRNDYGCPSSPRHMSAAIDKFGYNLPYHGLFGGVEMFTKEHYQMVNGFRNSYWGWGAEDDDLYRRIVKFNLHLTRPSMEVGRYSMIKHQQSEKPPDRMEKLQMAESAITTDGLLSLLYKVLLIKENLLYTLVRVDLRMEEDMVY